MGHQASVIFTSSDGEETDISTVATGAHIHVQVGEPNRAILDLIMVEGSVDAELVDVVVRHIKPGRRRWRRRLISVATLGDRFVRVVRG
jgi:predicted DNA-binding protein with PD1-like motif